MTTTKNLYRVRIWGPDLKVETRAISQIEAAEIIGYLGKIKAKPIRKSNNPNLRGEQ